MNSYGSGLLVLLVALWVSSCGGPDPQPQVPRADQPVTAGAPAGFNASDMVFAGAAIALFRQTTELTELVPERSANPSVVALAADIGSMQITDAQIVKALLAQWNSDSETSPSQVEQGNTVPGEMDDATMSRLNSLRGRQFDTLWLQSMIQHKQRAVELAEAETAHGSNVDAVAAARQFVVAYQAQIARMQQALAGG